VFADLVRWVSRIIATSADAAIESAAVEFNTDAWKLIVVRRCGITQGGQAVSRKGEITEMSLNLLGCALVAGYSGTYARRRNARLRKGPLRSGPRTFPALKGNSLRGAPDFPALFPAAPKGLQRAVTASLCDTCFWCPKPSCRRHGL
jgi:hypothetical protein